MNARVEVHLNVYSVNDDLLLAETSQTVLVVGDFDNIEGEAAAVGARVSELAAGAADEVVGQLAALVTAGDDDEGER